MDNIFPPQKLPKAGFLILNTSAKITKFFQTQTTHSHLSSPRPTSHVVRPTSHVPRPTSHVPRPSSLVPRPTPPSPSPSYDPSA